MKQQYCDNDKITFNLQGLLWVRKQNKTDYNHIELYQLALQYKTQSEEVTFPNEEIRDAAYEKARLLLIPSGQDDDAEKFHPRAMKLIRKKKDFLVVAWDESYFKQVYDLIRNSEMEKGRWTLEDESKYSNAF